MFLIRHRSLKKKNATGVIGINMKNTNTKGCSLSSTHTNYQQKSNIKEEKQIRETAFLLI